MPQDETSEAEVTAAMKPILDAFACGEIIARSVARAALTAAAQVRAQATHDQPMICRWCGKLHNGGPENCGKSNAEPAHAQPALMPIYGATEDLQQDLVQATSEPAEADRDHPVVERVARALWADRYPDDEWTAEDERDYLGHARAAIEAMRKVPALCYDAYNLDKVWSEANSTEVWNAWINAALR